MYVVGVCSEKATRTRRRHLKLRLVLTRQGTWLMCLLCTMYDMPWVCMGLYCSAIYWTVLYCTVLRCTVRTKGDPGPTRRAMRARGLEACACARCYRPRP